MVNIMEQSMFRSLLNSWIFFLGYEKNNDLSVPK